MASLRAGVRCGAGQVRGRGGAVEHGRPAVIAATSGISAVVDARGQVLYRSPEAEPAVHVAEIPAMRGLTPATRLGALPELALTLAGLGAVVAALVRARRTAGSALRTGQLDQQKTEPSPTG